MAENQDAASKTEEPTPRRLQQAREKGEVAKTPDLAPLAALAATAAVLALAGGWLARDMTYALLPFIQHPDDFQLAKGGGLDVAYDAIMAMALPLALILFTAALAGAAGNLIQHGFMWSPDRLAPKMEKVSPLAGFKRIFGIDGLVQFLKSLLKVTLTGLVAWWVLQPHAAQLQNLPALGPAAILPYSADLMRRLMFGVLALMLVITGADWFWQRYRFMQRMKMTKEELKEDFKQSEGDPHIKARQRQLRIEKSRRRMMQAVPEATVVIMNPTHYAVALKYEAEGGGAPQCVAKGVDALALRIRDIAKEAGVPVIEDPPLARALYAAVDVDQFIPVKHYEAVAKVIGFLMSAAQRRGARPARP
jgi:flagellar biosynthetic protein FlhB